MKKLLATLIAVAVFTPFTGGAMASSQEFTIDPNALTYGQNEHGRYFTSESQGLVHCEDFSCVVDADSSHGDASSWSTYIYRPYYFHWSYAPYVRYLRALALTK